MIINGSNITVLLQNIHCIFQSDKRGACEVLKSLDEKNRYRQGIVSALVSLYLSLEDRDGASTILRQAVDWHKKNKVIANCDKKFSKKGNSCVTYFCVIIKLNGKKKLF